MLTQTASRLRTNCLHVVGSIFCVWLLTSCTAAAPSSSAATSGGAAAESPVDSGVTVIEIEVTQAVPFTHYVPGDATSIIVHVENTNIAPIDAEGLLEVLADDATIFSDVVSVQLPANSRTEIVFEPVVVPDPSFSVDVRFDLVSLTTPRTVMATAASEDLYFTLTTTAPILLYTRLELGMTNTSAPDLSVVAGGVGDAFARAVFPISESDWFYREVNDVGVASSNDDSIDPFVLVHPPSQCSSNSAGIDGDSILTADEGEVIFDCLRSLRNRIVIVPASTQSAIGVNELVFLHGWINGNEIDVQDNGAATMDQSRLGYGTTLADIGQLIYAHELLHNVGVGGFGGEDIPGAMVTDTTGWDVNWHLPALASQRKENYYWIAAHGATEKSWISPDEYSWVAWYFGQYVLAALIPDPIFCTDPIVPGIPCLLENNVSIAGSLRSNQPFKLDAEAEVELAALHDIQRIPWPSQPTLSYTNYRRERDLPFRLVFWQDQAQPYDPNEFNDGVIAEIPFDARVSRFGVEAEDTIFLGFFEVFVPATIAENASAVTIEYPATGQSLPVEPEGGYRQAISDAVVPEPLEISFGD